MASIESYYGLQGKTIDMQEGATAGSFVAGDGVYTNASGQVILATTDKCIGIAHKAAAGVTGTIIPVELINSNEIYVMTSGGTTNQNQVGLRPDVSWSAGAHTVGTSAGTTGEVVIVGLHPSDGAMASGRVLVRFCTGNLLER